MKIRSIVIGILSGLLATLPSFGQDSQAKEIIRKADEKMRGDSRKAEVTMQIIRPSWTREISMTSWSKGQDYLMILITAPAREEGTAFMKRENEIWNYLPRVDRLIKLPPSMMSQSWMGSDFSNNDLVRESSIVTDYDHYLEDTETIDGREAYKIRMESKPDAPVVWQKVLAWVDKESYNQLKTEYYGEGNELIDQVFFKDFQMMDGRELATRMEMVPADEEGHKTILVYNNIDFGINLPEGFFSKQNMKNIRR